MGNPSASFRIRDLGVILLLILAMSLALGLTALVFSSPRLRFDDDFGIFWVSTRLQMSGRNPYDPQALNKALPTIGHREITEAIAVTWYAPHAFAGFLPLAWLPYSLARAIWFWASLIALALSFLWIWRSYHGPQAKDWLAWAIGFLSLPTLLMLQKGQVAWISLAGLIGFLYAIERENWVMVGLSLLLMSLKPHLVYLVLAAFLLQTHVKALWIAIRTCLVGFAAMVLLILPFNPSVFSQYLETITSHAPLQWATPTLGTWLRLALGVERTWLMVLPSLLGLTFLVIYWRARRSSWRWRRELPLLILISSATSAYGWSFDWVLLSWPIVGITASLIGASRSRKARALILTYIGINGLALFIHQHGPGDWALAWMPWALLVIYLWARTASGA